MYSTGRTTEALAGSIERVTFHNPDNGFAVLRLKVKGRTELVTVVGHLPSAATGEYVEAEGWWVIDNEHGQQFKTMTMRTTHPSSPNPLLTILLLFRDFRMAKEKCQARVTLAQPMPGGRERTIREPLLKARSQLCLKCDSWPRCLREARRLRCRRQPSVTEAIRSLETITPLSKRKTRKNPAPTRRRLEKGAWTGPHLQTAWFLRRNSLLS